MPTCPRHPDVPSTDLCVDCGDFVCGQCAYVLEDRRVLCPACQAKAGIPNPPARSERPAVRRFEPKPVPRPASTGAGAMASPSSPVTKPLLAALLLPILGCGCVPLPIVGMWLAFREIKKIDAGEATSSRSVAHVAIALNGLALLWWVFILFSSGK